MANSKRVLQDEEVLSDEEYDEAARECPHPDWVSEVDLEQMLDEAAMKAFKIDRDALPRYREMVNRRIDELLAKEQDKEARVNNGES